MTWPGYKQADFVPVFSLQIHTRELRKFPWRRLVDRDLKWSSSEKALARKVFDAALESELSDVMAEFKAKASCVASPSEIWELEGYLREKRRVVNEKYDYRYSQLIGVFARLIREGRIREEQLRELSEEKREYIRRMLCL